MIERVMQLQEEAISASLRRSGLESAIGRHPENADLHGAYRKAIAAEERCLAAYAQVLEALTFTPYP